jgi:hypothetical protein
MRKIVGTLLVGLPFIVMTGIMLATGGPALALGVWGIVGLVLACIWGGLVLLNPEA